jgi:hypothetical protein
MRCTGTQAFLTMLADAGEPYIFGTPGTTEPSLVDQLALRRKNILGLQELAERLYQKQRKALAAA